VIPPKKAKLTKAERRALQDQQRASKAGGPQDGENPPKEDTKQQQPPPQQEQQQTNKQLQQSETTKKEDQPVKGDDKTVDLFSHLPQYKGTCFLQGLESSILGQPQLSWTHN
jgi:hypothetical protein